MLTRDRYYNDSAFKVLVDQLVYLIERGQFTPTETREAAMLAQVIYEERNIKTSFTLDDIDSIRKN